MFCSKCGKEIAEDSHFCASCGCAIGNSGPATVDATVSKRKIKVKWIVWGIILLLLIVGILSDRNKPENAATMKEQVKVESPTRNEMKPVSWSDAQKSLIEARKAKRELDKSIGDIKKEWNGLKQQMKEAAIGAQLQDKPDDDFENSLKELKSVVKESKQAVQQTLSDKDVQDAVNALKAALQD